MERNALTRSSVCARELQRHLFKSLPALTRPGVVLVAFLIILSIALCGYSEQGYNVHTQASCLAWGGTQCPLVPPSPVSIILISKEGLSQFPTALPSLGPLDQCATLLDMKTPEQKMSPQYLRTKNSSARGSKCVGG